MKNCVPEKWGVIVNPGDRIKFYMPGFCSGDYTFNVIEKNGLVVLEDEAPSKIFDGCVNFSILGKEIG
jgi:hypothetical protein